MNAWIGVDLDGTLAEYHGWQGIDHIGAPIPIMVARIQKWLDEGMTVKVFTARAGEGPEQIKLIQDWCEKNIGRRLEVTATKDFEMIELWDDRCIRVVFNTGEPA